MADSKKIGVRSDVNLHKQKRAILTRQQLLRSARAIFARDGFEHARLEDIASKAGKTRGAFYANFENKEDVFCAIFEEDTRRDRVQLAPILGMRPSTEQRIEALGEYLSELSKDRERILLNIEFKLYAIRHPRSRKRLAALHEMMRIRSSIPELSEFLPQLAGPNISTPLIDSLAICGIVEGLALNHLFDPETLDSQELTRHLKLCLRETLQRKSRRADRKPK